ncbi:MAG: leucine-rich repeat domain-containing protein [Chthoniobacteraceae bacterium]
MTVEQAYERIEEACQTGATELEIVKVTYPIDLSPLRSLLTLHKLRIHWCWEVSDLSPLKELRSLESLDLSNCGKVSDLSPLQGLHGLKSLNLSGCRQVSDLSPLKDLSALQSLNLWGCGQVRDLSPLKDLSALQSLNLSWCGQVSDLFPLKDLSALRSLDLSGCGEVSDLSPLKDLSALQSLDLSSCGQVSDLSPLKDLSALQSFHLYGCKQVRDLSPLKDLSALQFLDLRGCGQSNVAEWIISHPALQTLVADCFTDVPAEVLSAEYDDNCLPRLRAWWHDREGEAVAEPEVKVFLLGNGSAGKTQLCRFLQDESFQAAWNSTHGVQLVHLPCEQPPVRAGAHLNVWDFGGQDIYHGTHALFLKSRAIFLILWTPELEAAALVWQPAADRDTARDNEDRLRPLAYWLQYVRELAGEESPVLLIQSKCEDRTLVQPPDAALAGMLPVLPPLSFSARTRYGGETLLGALRDAVAELHRAHPPHTYGRGWVTVRERCHALRAAGTRTLERAGFDALCAETGGVSDAGALLEVLHRSGVVFHRDDVFGGQVIVDQSWALEAIYTVFHREQCVPHLRGDGTFTRRELDRLAWGEGRRLRGEEPFTAAEQELFLSMMESCGICFAWKENAQGEQVYLAPELLPSREGVREQLVGRLRDSDLPRRQFLFNYRFLHEGVVRSLLSAVGRHAQDAAVYWRNGLWLYEAKSRAYAVLEARENPEAGAGAGGVDLAVYGDQSDELFFLLVDVLMHIEALPTESVEGPLMRARQRGEFSPGAGPAPTPALALESADFASPAPAPRGAPAIFTSYAWGDESPTGRQRAAVVERLCARLEAEGFKVRRDQRVMRTGDSITGFMNQFGTADRVVAILSDKYLKSTYCMAELHSLWQNSLHDVPLFQKRVRPLVLADAKIDDTLDRLARAKHWKEKHAGLEQAHAELGESFGEADYREQRLIGSFSREVSDMLRWLHDELMPRRFEEDGDFDELIALLRD